MNNENPHKYLLKYKPVSELINDVQDELPRFTDNGLIDTSMLIKVVQRCNAILGLKINPDREAFIEVNNYFGKLPSDFFRFNYAYLCREYQKTQLVGYPKRELKEITTLDPMLQCQVDPCQKQELCGKSYVMTNTISQETITIREFDVVSLKNTSKNICDPDCPNFSIDCPNEMSINGDQIDTTFKTGALYFNYSGLMEEDGKLLLPDHPLLEPFYNAALKKAIFNYLQDNGEAVDNLLNKYNAIYREEKEAATSLVSTGEYEQIQRIWARNRARVYNTIYRMTY